MSDTARQQWKVQQHAEHYRLRRPLREVLVAGLGLCHRCRQHAILVECPSDFCEWCCVDECGPRAHQEGGEE